jgi:hypothetical protein
MSLLDAVEYTISDPDAGSPSTDAVLGVDETHRGLGQDDPRLLKITLSSALELTSLGDAPGAKGFKSKDVP